MGESVVDALAIARSEFARRLAMIGPADWGRPTPCDEWDVRRLVNHIVSHEYRFADNIATNNIEWYVASRDSDFLAEDPQAAWRKGTDLLDQAIAGLPTLETVIQWRVPVSARELLAVRLFEAVVHTWDLSRALDYDDTIDPRLAAPTLLMWERLTQTRSQFFAAPEGRLDPEASTQHRLLHLAGRL